MDNYSHSDLLVRHPLYIQFDALCGREGLASGDIAKLKGRVSECADRSEHLLSKIGGVFRQYTLHNLEHAFNVAERIHEFLPRDEAGAIPLNGLELALLWFAVLLHDSGMAVSDDERQRIEQTDEYKSFRALHRQTAVSPSGDGTQSPRLAADALFAEFVRERHAERARGVLEKDFSDLLVFNGKSLVDVAARLCESHNWGVRYSSDPRRPDKCISRLAYDSAAAGYPVNEQYLACCLRLGDILDLITPGRPRLPCGTLASPATSPSASGTSTWGLTEWR